MLPTHNAVLPLSIPVMTSEILAPKIKRKKIPYSCIQSGNSCRLSLSAVPCSNEFLCLRAGTITEWGFLLKIRLIMPMQSGFSLCVVFFNNGRWLVWNLLFQLVAFPLTCTFFFPPALLATCPQRPIAKNNKQLPTINSNFPTPITLVYYFQNHFHSAHGKNSFSIRKN